MSSFKERAIRGSVPIAITRLVLLLGVYALPQDMSAAAQILTRSIWLVNSIVEIGIARAITGGEISQYAFLATVAVLVIATSTGMGMIWAWSRGIDTEALNAEQR